MAPATNVVSYRSIHHFVQRVAMAACAGMLVLFFLPLHVAAQPTADANLITQIDQAGQHREADLLGYTVEEHYTITNSYFKLPAVADVRVVYGRDAGKHYEVISRNGPSLLAVNLLNSMLADEQKLSLNPTRSHAVVSSANYIMSGTGSEVVGGRSCTVLSVEPRQKSSYVINGRIWVDAASGLLVKIGGVPPQSPSFFASRPSITRDYGEMNGFSLASHSHAVSSSFLTGKTTVDIDYIHYQITSNPAAAPIR